MVPVIRVHLYTTQPSFSWWRSRDVICLAVFLCSSVSLSLSSYLSLTSMRWLQVCQCPGLHPHGRSIEQSWSAAATAAPKWPWLLNHLARFLLIWTWMTSRFSECIRWMQDDVGMARESPNPSLRSFQPWQKDLLKLQQLCSFPSGPGELQRQSYCNLLHVYICPELIWA